MESMYWRLNAILLISTKTKMKSLKIKKAIFSAKQLTKSVMWTIFSTEKI